MRQTLSIRFSCILLIMITVRGSIIKKILNANVTKVTHLHFLWNQLRLSPGSPSSLDVKYFCVIFFLCTMFKRKLLFFFFPLPPLFCWFYNSSDHVDSNHSSPPSWRAYDQVGSTRPQNTPPPVTRLAAVMMKRGTGEIFIISTRCISPSCSF